MYLLKIQVFNDVTPCGLVNTFTIYYFQLQTDTVAKCNLLVAYGLFVCLSVCLYVCAVSHPQVGVVKSTEI